MIEVPLRFKFSCLMTLTLFYSEKKVRSVTYTWFNTLKIISSKTLFVPFFLIFKNFTQVPFFFSKSRSGLPTIQNYLGWFLIDIFVRNKISYIILILPYKDMITIDYEISYFGFNFDRKSTYNLELLTARSVILRPVQL